MKEIKSENTDMDCKFSPKSGGASSAYGLRLTRLIGIIGQTGAGKSTVCAALAARGAQLLRKKSGYDSSVRRGILSTLPVIDGDVLAREATAQGSPVLTKLAAEFGADILESGRLNRRELARRAFASPQLTAKLNSIIHPAITALVRERLAGLASPVVFLEGAALLENPLADECSAFIAVTAPKEIRLARLLARDNLNECDILLRMSVQHSEEVFCDYADFVIVNDGAQDILPQIDAILEEILCQS